MPDPAPLSERLLAASLRDRMTVTAAGQRCDTLIEGVQVRDLVLHTDDRGTVVELYDPRWGWHPDPMVFSYCYTVRPGWVKGWAMHLQHEDRYCLLAGEMKVVLFDSREGSPSHGKVLEIYLSEQRRQILSIPAGVWHADENVGTRDAMIVNFPTIQYDHAKPDKYRLPPGTPLIPYQFKNAKGY